MLGTKTTMTFTEEDFCSLDDFEKKLSDVVIAISSQGLDATYMQKDPPSVEERLAKEGISIPVTAEKPEFLDGTRTIDEWKKHLRELATPTADELTTVAERAEALDKLMALTDYLTATADVKAGNLVYSSARRRAQEKLEDETRMIRIFIWRLLIKKMIHSMIFWNIFKQYSKRANEEFLVTNARRLLNSTRKTEK